MRYKGHEEERYPDRIHRDGLGNRILYPVELDPQSDVQLYDSSQRFTKQDLVKRKEKERQERAVRRKFKKEAREREREAHDKREREAYLERLAKIHARCDAQVRGELMVWPEGANRVPAIPSPGPIGVRFRFSGNQKLIDQPVSIHKCCDTPLRFIGKVRLQCVKCDSIYMMYNGILHKEKK